MVYLSAVRVNGAEKTRRKDALSDFAKLVGTFSEIKEIKTASGRQREEGHGQSYRECERLAPNKIYFIPD